ncbi:MAG: DNA/RNA non-specific endonuclease [Candidatus Pacebacteria bacterium]|jgi:endonuclease G|nr:DNA/RNA non-specific endonuclease [Candidatus Paceibacterota bacterium]
MKQILIGISLLIGSVAFGQELGDVTLSKHTDIKKHFTEEVCDQILTDTFTICYDYKRKSPLAVYTVVTAKTVNLKNIDPRPPFYTDKRLEKNVATSTKDYTGTGYDRGHLGASDASHDWSQKTLKATYSMANIVPQTKRANRYKFVSLEKLEREMAVVHGTLEMLTLVYFNDKPKVIGKSGLQVPSAFAKVFSAKDHRECFFVWNTDKYDKYRGKNPYTYKQNCKVVFALWGTQVGEASKFSDENKKELMDLLQLYVDSEKNMSRSGVAKALMQILKTQ